MRDVVRELERLDAAAAAALERAGSLERSLEELRARAAATAELLARLPAAQERADRALDQAETLAEAARAALAGAGEETAPTLRRRLELSERGLAAAASDLAAVELDASHADAERERVDAEARGVSELLASLERVHAVEPPAPGLAGVLDWTSRARAAVFVVRCGLEQERERIVREAEELGAALLGEQVYTVQALVDRLSRHVPLPGNCQAEGHVPISGR